MIYTGDWTEKGVASAAEKALASRATMVISMGYMSSNYYSEKQNKNKFVLNKNKNTSKLALSMSGKFFKSTISSFLVTLVMLTFIIGILSLAQSFVQFDTKNAVVTTAQNTNTKSFILNKGYSFDDNIHNVNKQYAIEVNDQDIEVFKNAGYQGNIYKLYNTPVITNYPYSIDISNEMGIASYSYTGIYSNTAVGTLVCDTEFLQSLFGDIKVVAGSIEDTVNTSKLIVTDYFADSIVKLCSLSTETYHLVSNDPSQPYKNILDKLILCRYTIGAVINTGYKERYPELISSFERVFAEKHNAQDIIAETLKSNDCASFFEEANTSLNFTFSLNPNFVECYRNEGTRGVAVYCRNMTVYHNNSQTIFNASNSRHFYELKSLPENSIVMDITNYNKLFGTNITDVNSPEFEENTITITNYTYDKNTKESTPTTLTLTVVWLTRIGEGCLGLIDSESYSKLYNDALVPYALVFDNVEQAYELNNTGKEIYFYI